MILAQSLTALAVDQRISFAVGGTALFILLALLVGLAAFGGGREHS